MPINKNSNLKRLGMGYPSEPGGSPAITNANSTGPYSPTQTYYVWTTSGPRGIIASGSPKSQTTAVGDRNTGFRRNVSPTATEKFTTQPISYWIVGGGGGGGSGNTAGAGGGGGGYGSGSFSISSTNIEVIVGGGGTGHDSLASETYPGIGQGDTTVFGPGIAIGGGRGANGGGSAGNSSGPPDCQAFPGASGGGGARFNGTGGSGTPGIGFAGGSTPGCPGFGSAGGGGAGAVGEDFLCHPLSQAGMGGYGIRAPATYQPFPYGGPGPAGGSYFCGGGGGIGWNGVEAMLGGYGGGAGWNTPTTPRPGSVGAAVTFNALANSGGGGAGASGSTNPLGPTPFSPEYRGGNGGSGLIIAIIPN